MFSISQRYKLTHECNVHQERLGATQPQNGAESKLSEPANKTLLRRVFGKGILAWFVPILVSAPALAQEAPSSESLLAGFVERCAEIEANPAAALLSDEVIGAVTADGAVTVINHQHNVSSDIFSNLSYSGNVLDGGTRTNCNLVIPLASVSGGPHFENIAEVIGREAEAILGGPVVAKGGPVMAGSEAAYIGFWALQDGLPPSAEIHLNHTQYGLVITIIRLKAEG